jgi:6,7-dimethyl-8-ribityllumazine synthase
MKNIAIIYGTYHQDYALQMLEAVRAAALTKKIKIATEVPVPGSMEKPLAIKRLLLQKEIDAVVVLGIIEKGETQHGLVMGQAVIQAIINLQLEFMKPIGTAILGPGIEPEQIPPRAIAYALNAFNAVCIMLE